MNRRTVPRPPRPQGSPGCPMCHWRGRYMIKRVATEGQWKGVEYDAIVDPCECVGASKIVENTS